MFGTLLISPFKIESISIGLNLSLNLAKSGLSYVGYATCC